MLVLASADATAAAAAPAAGAAKLACLCFTSPAAAAAPAAVVVRNKAENAPSRTGKHSGPEGRNSAKIEPKKCPTSLLKPLQR